MTGRKLMPTFDRNVELRYERKVMPTFDRNDELKRGRIMMPTFERNDELRYDRKYLVCSVFDHLEASLTSKELIRMINLTQAIKEEWQEMMKVQLLYLNL